MMRILKKRVTIFYEPCYILQSTGQSDIFDPNIYTVKIMRMRKAASNTEHPAIRQISVLSPALLVVVLFMYWVVWIVMKWIV